MKFGIIHTCLKVLFFIYITVNAFDTNAEFTEKVYLTGKGYDDAVEWDFYCTKGSNSGKWTKIPVPSNWEFHGFGRVDILIHTAGMIYTDYMLNATCMTFLTASFFALLFLSCSTPVPDAS